ncbi:MAG: mechanosensitive ion channel [Phycisphaera sp.]|nr:mechanosensitive ion channel [Phycisphaera sp.]
MPSTMAASRPQEEPEATTALEGSESQETTESSQPAAPPSNDAIEQGPGIDDQLEEARGELERLISTPGTEESRLRSQRNLVEILTASLRAERKIAEFNNDIAVADAVLAEATERVRLAEDAVALLPDSNIDLAASSMKLLDADARVSDLVRELADVEGTIDRRESRRASARIEAAERKAALAVLDEASEETVDLRQPKRRRARLETRAFELEIRSFDVTDGGLRTRQKAIELELRIAREEQEAWQLKVDGLEVDDVRRKLDSAEMIAASETDPLLESVALANLSLAERLVGATERDNERALLLMAKKRLLDRLRRGTESDQRRFTGRVTPAIATVLRQRDKALPDLTDLREEIAELRKLIPEVELKRLLLEDQLASVRGAARTAAVMMDEVIPPMSNEKRAEIEERLESLLEDQVEVYGRPLLKAIIRQMEELNGLLATDLSVVFEIQRYRSFVLEQTVWVRDSAALEPGFWSRVAEQGRVFFDPGQWSQLGGLIVEETLRQPLVTIMVVSPGGILLLFRRRIRQRVRLAGDRVARAETDRFRETLLVVGLNVFFGLAIALPCWFVGVAVEMDYGRSAVLGAIGHVFTVASVFAIVLGLLSATVGGGGLAERHFRWSEQSILIARRLVYFTWAAVLFGICNRMCDPRQLDLPDLGRLFFSPIPIIVAAFLFSVVRSGWDRTLVEKAGGRIPLEKYRGERLLILGVACIPVISLVFANIGWYEAVSLIQRAVLASVLFLFILLLMREILHRGLHARMRNASWQLRRQREDGADTAGEVGELEEIGERTASAIRFCVVTFLLLGLWSLWISLLPAFHILQGTELWSYRTADPAAFGDGGSMDQVLVAVTVGDLVLAIGIIASALYAARNFPTLVELLILDRVGLERGVKYAVAQLIQWVLIIAGVTAACAMIGVTWASVQWLAAGFTVGLGFGLQEIFANFISGLIILFEQPVRVGDVVTVGNTTGQISRIRMRSTTITDWDRKELIVPNKQFITTEVVNWSLGESCIRLVLPVGASYESDPDRVCEILLGLGIKDPATLVEPAPSVSFSGFGESSLNFELRVYLPGTDSLSDVRNRLNTAIKKAFEQNGIGIPFPQRDVRVSLVDRGDPDGGRSAPMPSPSNPSNPDSASGESS